MYLINASLLIYVLREHSTQDSINYNLMHDGN